MNLTLCRSYLKPYCMGRKTVLFQRAFKSKSALEPLGQHGTFKSQALWSVRYGKGLRNIITAMRIFSPYSVTGHLLFFKNVCVFFTPSTFLPKKKEK
jgi:hypothetical protein